LFGILFKNNLLRFSIIFFTIISFFIVRHYQYVINLAGYFNITYEKKHKLNNFPALNSYELANLGWAHSDKIKRASSYTKYLEEKEDGIIRIGIFGGSYVEGIETDYNHDFPSFLQKKFNDINTNVEIINFGVKSYGIHQSYLLWQYLGSRYNLDYIVVLAFNWHIPRDSAFVYPYLKPSSYGPVHARYINKNEKLKFIEVIGQNRSLATKNFYSLIPKMQYTRYSLFNPPFLKAYLPESYHLVTNPFYYILSNDNDKEIIKTYKTIFENISKKSRGLFVITRDESIYNIKQLIDVPNLIFYKAKSYGHMENNTSLYSAPLYHKSSMGNDMLANELFSVLNNKDSKIDYIKLDRLVFKSYESCQNLKPLHEYKSVYVTLKEKKIAEFTKIKEGSSIKYDFKNNNTASLLLNNINHNNLRFTPLKYKFGINDTLFVSYKKGNKTINLVLGEINALSNIIGQIKLSNNVKDINDYKNNDQNILVYVGDSLKDVYFKSSEIIEDVKVFLNDRKLFSYKINKNYGNSDINNNQLSYDLQKYTQSEYNENNIYLRSYSGSYADISTFKKNGTIDIVFENTNELISNSKCPMLSYVIRDFEVSLPNLRISH